MRGVLGETDRLESDPPRITSSTLELPADFLPAKGKGGKGSSGSAELLTCTESGWCEGMMDDQALQRHCQLTRWKSTVEMSCRSSSRRETVIDKSMS